jgi:SAM-dependent methyltransferase
MAFITLLLVRPIDRGGGVKFYANGFLIDGMIGSGGLMVDEKVSREWDEASKPWADFVRISKDYFREEMNNPATLRMVGNVKGKQLLDLSCGEGYNTRILAKKGARVIGVDFSKEMIKLAREREKRDRLGIARARTITIYTNKRNFKVQLGIPDEETIYIFLVGKDGRILLRIRGDFTQEKYRQLQNAICTDISTKEGD